MYLKGLELEGFKSFCEKTYIEFTNGITSIVGPNGSGKSNILDAILWVLGEQSYKNIRAGNSNDVIFSGGKNKRAASSAYVSLIISNEDRYLEIEEDEVKITRRIYKNGEGEYLINNKRVRLKDIHNLFMDTGIGKQAYSIIGQGRVERIISSNPKEVREILEEAAGTKRAKIEKEQALKKLENILVELEKIIYVEKELETRVKKLETESKKASLYNDLIFQIDVNTYMLTKFNIEKIKNDQAQLQEKKENLENTIKEIETKLDNENLKLSFLMQDRKVKNDRVNELKLKISNDQNLIDEEKVRLNEFEKNKSNFEVKLNEKIKLKDKLLNDKNVYEEKIKVLEKETKDTKNTLDKKFELKTQLSEKIEKINKDKEFYENKISEKDNILKEIELLNYKLKMENEDLERKIKLSDNNILTLDKEKQNFILEKEKEKLILENLENQYSKDEQESKKINDNNLNILKQIEILENEKNDILKEKKKQIYELEQKKSKYDAIKKTLDDNVYANKGSSYILSNFKNDDNIVGMVSNLIDIPEKYLIAISNLISFNLNDIVINKAKEVKKYIDKLKEEKISTASFLPLDNIKISNILTKLPDNKGVIDFARNLVNIKDKKLDVLLKHIFSNALVVEDISVANEIMAKGYYDRIITLDGDLISAKGRITGGFRKNKLDLTLQKKDDLNKIEKEINLLNENLINKENSYNQLEEKIQELNSKKMNNTLSLQINDLINKIDLVKNTLSNIDRKIATIDYELNDSKNHIIENENKIFNNKNAIEQNRAKLNEVFDERETLEFDLSKIEDPYKYEKKLNEVSIAYAVLNEKLTNNKNNLDQFVEMFNQITSDLDEIHKFEYNKEELFANFNISINDSKNILENLLNDKNQNNLDLNNLEKEIKNDEKLESEGIKLINSLEKDILKHSNNIENISEKIGRNSKEIEILIENISKINEEEILKSDIYKVIEEKDISGIKKLISSLENKKENIGSINFSSIEEYEIENQRYQILLSQKVDLQKSVKSIEDLISKIEKEMSDKFTYALNEIRNNFKYMCSEIFYGAKGDLKLTDPSNILTTGIELSVKYKNKPEQTLMLLSGGEKSMLAVSFIMAIFMYKPSPFTFFDEIEAALDETNTRKIVQLLKRFIDKSQFILITHNKETMKGSDRLYGVTMNKEIGESRIVSVDI